MGWQDDPVIEQELRPELPTWQQDPIEGELPSGGGWQNDPIEGAPRDYALTDIPGRWKETMGPSLWKAGTQYANAFLHPIQTAQTAGAVGAGLGADVAAAPERGARWAAEKVLTAIGADEAAKNLREAPQGAMTQARAAMREAFPAAAQASDAVIDNYVEAYGGWENFKRTLAEDPVRVFQDAAALASLGGAAASKMGLTKTGTALSTVGKVADPIWIGEKVAKGVAQGIGATTKAVTGPLLSGRGYQSMTDLVNGTEVAPHVKIAASIKEVWKLPLQERAILAVDTIGKAIHSTSATTVAAASAIGVGIATEFLGPAAVGYLAALSPTVIGEAAWAAGRVKSMIVQPIIAAERTMRAIGIPTSAVRIGAEQTSRAQAQLEENKQKLTGTIVAKAGELGYKLHPNVVNKLADQLLSEDPEVYRRGIDALAKNKRLSDVITKIGDDAVAAQKKTQAGGQQ